MIKLFPVGGTVAPRNERGLYRLRVPEARRAAKKLSRVDELHCTLPCIKVVYWFPLMGFDPLDCLVPQSGNKNYAANHHSNKKWPH